MESAQALIEVQRELFRRYGESDYRGALELIEREAPRIDALWTKVAWWRACLLARLGEEEAALDALEAAVEAGAWWSETTFHNEPDFASLRDHPRFGVVVLECESQRRAFAPQHPGLLVEAPPGDGPHPVLLPLHGRAETFEATVGYWALPALQAGWAAAVPESSQRDSVDGPVWDDPDRAAEEIDRHVAVIRDEPGLGADRVVLGGYSQGGRRALQLALELAPRFRGVMVLCPTVLRTDDVAEVLSSLGNPPHPAVWILTGDRDPAYEGQQMLAETLRSEGLSVEMEVIPGMGHYYPTDFSERLRWALAHLL